MLRILSALILASLLAACSEGESQKTAKRQPSSGGLASQPAAMINEARQVQQLTGDRARQQEEQAKALGIGQK